MGKMKGFLRVPVFVASMLILLFGVFGMMLMGPPTMAAEKR